MDAPTVPARTKTGKSRCDAYSLGLLIVVAVCVAVCDSLSNNDSAILKPCGIKNCSKMSVHMCAIAHHEAIHGGESTHDGSYSVRCLHHCEG